MIEVGLGGRLDATNVVDPELSVITPIDFDHDNVPGPHASKPIAAEKAGILKPGVPAVFATQRPEAAEVSEPTPAELGIHVERLRRSAVRDLDINARGARFT